MLDKQEYIEMIGKTVEFPVEHGIYEVGVVKQYCDTTGKLTVEDDNGDLWAGYEYQVINYEEG